MLDVEQPITPGEGLGGVVVGASVEDVLAVAEPLRVIDIPGDDEDPDGVTIHSFGAIRTWSVNGLVVQVGAFEGYAGRTEEGIGVGSSIADVVAAHGEVAPHGAPGFIVIPTLPGVGVETTEWTSPDTPDPAATILQIFVHAAE